MISCSFPVPRITPYLFSLILSFTCSAQASNMRLAAAASEMQNNARAKDITQVSEAAAKSIPAYLSETYRGYGGIQVGVVHNGMTIFQSAIGSTGKPEVTPLMSPTDLLHTASITKQFTGWAIAQLIESRKLNLSDSIETVIKVPEPLNGIKIADLLGHTDGLVSPDVLMDAREPKKPSLSQQEALQLILNQAGRKKLKAGEYGNAGYILLAEVITKITGKTYSQYIRENILVPAGMINSFIVSKCDELPKTIASSIIMDTHFKPIEKNYTTCFEGGIGLASNANDLSKWMLYLLSENNKKSEVAKIYFQQLSKVRTGAGETPYGMGLFIEKKNTAELRATKRPQEKGVEVTLAHHDGNLFGYQHSLAMIPELNLGVVVLANASTTYSKKIAQDVLYYLSNMDEQNLHPGYQVCDSIHITGLAGVYTFGSTPYSIQLASDGKCLWQKYQDQLRPVFFTTRNTYGVGVELKLERLNWTDANLRPKLVLLQDEVELERAFPINLKKVDGNHLLGTYRSKDGQQVKIFSEKNHLKINYDGVVKDLLWSNGLYFHFSDSKYDALKFEYATDGKVLGLSFFFNKVPSGRYEKTSPSRVRDVLTASKAVIEKSSPNPNISTAMTKAEEEFAKTFSTNLLPLLEQKKFDNFAQEAFEEAERLKKRSNPVEQILSIMELRKEMGSANLDWYSLQDRKRLHKLDRDLHKLLLDAENSRNKSILAFQIFWNRISTPDGEFELKKAIELIQNEWFRLPPEMQYSIAVTLAPWNPISALRIAQNSARLGNSKVADKLIKKLFDN